MSQDDHWTDNPIIRATAHALNIEIYIISYSISIMFLLEVCLNPK